MSAPEIINPPGGGGGGGGTVTGTGTPGTLAKFTGTGTSIGDSGISDDGATVSFVARNLASTATQTTWTLGNPNSTALIVKSNAGPESTLVLDTIGRGVGIGGSPGTLLHVQDGSGFPFAGSAYEGVRLQRSTEALFSSSDYTRSFRAGLTGATAVVGTSTAHDLLLQRGNVTAATLQSGAIATVTLTAGGTGYTNGTYSQQALTGGTGAGATADIVVAGGIVTSCVVRSPGSGYTAADALSCAVIGAGAGFVLTVATIAQIVAGSGNLTALGRIGAGTATPRAALDVAGGGWISGFGQANVPLIYSQTTGILSLSQNWAGLRLGIDTFDASVIGANVCYAIDAKPQLTNLAGGSFTGLQVIPNIISSSGVNSITGSLFRHVRATPGDLAAQNVTGSSVLIQAFTGAASAASYSYNGVTGFQLFHNFSAAGTTGTLTAFNAGGFTLSAGHVVTTSYGLRLQAASINGGASITNRWGISQEDTAANNYFAGNVGAGTASPTANLQVTQGTSGVGTVSNSAAGTTVTGSGTQFLNTFKTGDTITIGGQTVAITAIASNISMTTAAITSANSGVGYTLVGGTRFSAFGNGNVSISTGALTVRTVANPNSYAIVAQDDIAIYTGTDATGTTSLRLGSSTSLPQGCAAVKGTKTAAGGSGTMTFQTATGGVLGDRMTIDATGQVGIGTASPTGRLHVVGGTAAAATNGAPVTIIAQSAGTGNQNGGNIVLTPGALSGSGSAGVADLSGPTGTGLKLPATPGNIDVQVLDCYAEGTWTPTLAGFVTNTPGTITASYTRVGRMVTLNVYLYAGGSSFGSTLGTTTVTVPALMSPTFYGVGHGGLSRTTSSVAQVIAYYDGKIYLGTSASAVSEMWISVTYFV